MARVTWTNPATRDLEAICEYIARESPYQAARFAERAVQATERLRLFPRSGRVAAELG
ncbi:MAG: type II toxin-antitoxin system RelE/ParE family toxin, partial [Dehalococcoidia bacterium]